MNPRVEKTGGIGDKSAILMTSLCDDPKFTKRKPFEGLGDAYPYHLEEHYERILTKIEEIWDKPALHDYFSDLLIDKRGGRKGFQKEILNEIITLREFRELETFRVAEEREDAIRELARHGIRLNESNFFYALHNGNKELIDLFVRSAFNLHVSDQSGNPPLMIALKNGYSVMAKILLDAGADVNERDRMGLTPLLVACGKRSQGYKAVAEALINKGAFINVRDSLGFTPLLLSLSGGTVEIARLLIERGADVLACTKKGETALSLARKSRDIESIDIVELLISRGAIH